MLEAHLQAVVVGKRAIKSIRDVRKILNRTALLQCKLWTTRLIGHGLIRVRELEQTVPPVAHVCHVDDSVARNFALNREKPAHDIAGLVVARNVSNVGFERVELAGIGKARWIAL